MSGKPPAPHSQKEEHRPSVLLFFLGVFLYQNDEYREKGNPTPIKNGTIITIFYYIYTLYS